jgi:hypothetical protein
MDYFCCYCMQEASQQCSMLLVQFFEQVNKARLQEPSGTDYEYYKLSILLLVTRPKRW